MQGRSVQAGVWGRDVTHHSSHEFVSKAWYMPGAASLQEQSDLKAKWHMLWYLVQQSKAFDPFKFGSLLQMLSVTGNDTLSHHDGA